ncbi:MAG: Fe-S-containing hydro-lyase [Clostridia bacterium]|nr:Fe-S-containing hydro-lyase [Clostridia bacterium]
MERHVTTPITKECAAQLRAGDTVYITGEMYVARDAAHKRLYELISAGKPLPVDLTDETVYYMGPSPAREGRVIGSAGPTTSSRMDKYTPSLLALGLRAMIGKGRRSDEVKAAMAEHGAVYFAAIGGAGALLSERIVKCETVCYEDLGAETLRRITVVDFPCIVAIDTEGNDVYSEQTERHG